MPSEPERIVKRNEALPDSADWRYEFQDAIASGGWGTVYKARHKELGQIVAVKVLHDHLAGDGRMVRRFEQEAKLASLLKHRNIVQIIDFGVTPKPFIVMEYLEGRNLADELARQGAFAAERALAVMLSICSALAAAHECGVIHRDIKPSNITLVGAGDDLKILDFGLSKTQADDVGGGGIITRTGEALGSPPYMSPEQWTGHDISVHSDIYSLGCLLYELVTGRQAFVADNATACMHLHMTALPTAVVFVRPDLPEAELLDRIIFKAISKVPADRYSSVQEMAADLERARTGAPLLHAGKRRYGLFDGLRRHSRRLFKIALAVMTLVLAAAALAYVNRDAILNEIWQVNYRSGINALARKDYQLAGAKLTAALQSIDYTGAKDKRLYWTLCKLQTVLKAEQRWPDLSVINQRVRELTRGNQKSFDQLEIAKLAIDHGDYPLAVKSCQEAIAAAKQVSPDNLAIAECEEKLGNALITSGKYREAEKVLLDSLRIRRAWLDKDDLLTARSLHNLGLVYLYTQRFTDAKKVYEDLLQLRLRVLGPDNQQVANTLNSLGSANRELKDYRTASAQFKRAVAIWRETLGPDSSTEALTLCNVGRCLYDQKDYAAAEPIYRRAMAISEKALGQGHPETAIAIYYVGLMRLKQHDLNGALPYFQRALSIRTAKLGADNPLTLQIKSQIDEVENELHKRTYPGSMSKPEPAKSPPSSSAGIGPHG